ncbi:hypothetical protein HELRODRAFT_171329 [Helobdella robusta]|uniref:Voltage-dependent calcium channel alpha-2/delta subunit conserved region domain-containing protein n=1 Tax=Helobdella robusta TaxID=6412 RepID=T1F446_HELRO|nr:hypothetical protein HELRODRAFT_171329 [Helobdella robusta]ESO05671.1 hypothetical protein HELRODRAFT_171329 [Helobdella robusta]
MSFKLLWRLREYLEYLDILKAFDLRNRMMQNRTSTTDQTYYKLSAYNGENVFTFIVPSLNETSRTQNTIIISTPLVISSHTNPSMKSTIHHYHRHDFKNDDNDDEEEEDVEEDDDDSVKEAVAGVVGAALKTDTFSQIIFDVVTSMTFCDDNKECKHVCMAGVVSPTLNYFKCIKGCIINETEDVSCYLIDDSGFVIFSSMPNRQGYFVGEVEGMGPIMKALIITEKQVDEDGGSDDSAPEGSGLFRKYVSNLPVLIQMMSSHLFGLLSTDDPLTDGDFFYDIVDEEFLEDGYQMENPEFRAMMRECYNKVRGSLLLDCFRETKTSFENRKFVGDVPCFKQLIYFVADTSRLPLQGNASVCDNLCTRFANSNLLNS